MTPSPWPGTAIVRDDLDVIAQVAMMRLPLRAAESLRLERMRTLLEAESELARALAAHAHCGLVNFRGTHGTGDLAAETETLVAALERFGRLVTETAAEYRRSVTAPAVPLELVATAPARPHLMVG